MMVAADIIPCQRNCSGLDMARQKFLSQAMRLAMFAVLVIKTPAFGAAGSISLGIDAATARHALNIASNHDAELGIWVFPDANGMVYTYRFDSKFGGKISGIQIGEAISDVIATLGPELSPPRSSVWKKHLLKRCLQDIPYRFRTALIAST
jgi:hypothetical protein